MIAIADPALPVPRPLVFGDARLSTDGEILALAFAAGGSLWSVEEPGLARHWDAGTGQPLGWHFLSDLETAWCFGPGARLLASGSDDLTLWDVPSGQVLWAAGQPSWVTALAFSGDGSLLAAGHDDGAVRVWELRGRRLLGEYRGHTLAVSALAFAPGGGQLASAGEDRLIRLWEVPAGRALHTLAGHTDRITTLAWHPREPRLVSGGWDAVARLWDTATGQPALLLNTHAAPVSGVAFSPRGDVLATADVTGEIQLWQFSECRRLNTIPGAGEEVRCLAFSPDGRRLAGGSERRLALWDAGTGGAVAAGGAVPPARAVLALSPDGRQLVGADAGGRLLAWDAASARPLGELRTPEGDASPARSAAYSPDGRLAAGGEDGRVRLWEGGNNLAARVLDGMEGPATALAFSPDGKTLASASATSGEVWLWDPASGEPVLLIPDALDGCAVEALAFHPQGRLLAVGGIDWLATGGSNGAVCLWDLVERCEVATFAEGTTCLAMHPAGRWLASASLVRTLCVWDLEQRDLLVEVTGPEEQVTALAYSPDGTWLAAGGEDRVLRLWRVTEGRPEEVDPIEVQLDTQVQVLCFSPDGRWLYTANGNRTCYRLDVGQLQATGEGGAQAPSSESSPGSP